MRGNKIVFLRVYEPHRPPVITPPLGIASLIRYLKEKHNGLEFKTYDFATDKDVMDKIISDNKGEEPIFFGISGMLKNYSLIHRTAASLKNHFPSVPIVVGGPVVSSLKRLTLNSKHIDYAIANEGEVPLSMLLKSITDGNPPLSSIPSLIYRNNGEIFQNPNESAILREDEIPMPDLEAVDITKYFKFQGFEHAGIRPYLPLMTSRGCPYSCVYCHGIFGQKVRFVPTEKITEHIKYYTKKYSIKDIEIYDDIFNINENRAKDIITEILKINPDIHFLFPNGLRTDILSKDFISFLGTHNTSYISIAVESASERIQKLIKKRLDLDKLKANVELLSKYKILLHAYFMLGFPTETKEEMLKTIDFAKRLPVHTASFFKVTPHLGTELFEMCSEEIKENIISDAINTDNIRYYSPKINISSVDNKVLNRLHKYAVLSFYLRPKQLLKIFLIVKKLKTLFIGGKIFMKIITGKYKQ